MISTRLFIILILISFAGHAFPQSDPHPDYLKIPLEKALQDHRLVKAMYQQINPGIIQNDQQAIITVRINFNHTIITIYGRLEQWIAFFLMDPAISSARQTAIL